MRIWRRWRAKWIAWRDYGICGYCPQCMAIEMAVLHRLERKQ